MDSQVNDKDSIHKSVTTLSIELIAYFKTHILLCSVQYMRDTFTTLIYSTLWDDKAININVIVNPDSSTMSK